MFLPDGEAGALHRGRIGYIRNHGNRRFAEVARRFGQQAGSDVHQHDPVAFRREPTRHRTTDGAGSPGYHREPGTGRVRHVSTS